MVNKSGMQIAASLSGITVGQLGSYRLTDSVAEDDALCEGLIHLIALAKTQRGNPQLACMTVENWARVQPAPSCWYRQVTHAFTKACRLRENQVTPQLSHQYQMDNHL